MHVASHRPVDLLAGHACTCFALPTHRWPGAGSGGPMAARAWRGRTRTPLQLVTQVGLLGSARGGLVHTQCREQTRLCGVVYTSFLPMCLCAPVRQVLHARLLPHSAQPGAAHSAAGGSLGLHVCRGECSHDVPVPGAAVCMGGRQRCSLHVVAGAPVREVVRGNSPLLPALLGV